MNTHIFHNPRCKKSRDAVDYLNTNEIEHTVIKYLESPPSKQELRNITKKLGITPSMLVRTKEKLYKELNLGKSDLTDDQWLTLLAENPVLIERPIVVHGKKAAIGRPLDHVIALFE